MKNKMLIFGLIAFIGLFGMSMNQTISSKIDVPGAVIKAFNKKFPTAQKVNWEMEDEGEYEAEFQYNGNEMSANFKEDGTWLETETEIKTSDLPQAVKNAISTQFKGYEVEEAEKVESHEIALAYEVTLENEDDDTEMEVVFSPDGKVLKKKVIDEDDDDDDDDDKG